MHIYIKTTCFIGVLSLIHAPDSSAIVLQKEVINNLDKTRQSEDTEIIGEETIVVTGKKRGGLITDSIPDQVFNETDIGALGASSLGELIQLIQAEVSNNRDRSIGPPVVLLNGRRISGFREIGNYPPEALARVEVYSEDVALRYGFSADQLILNFVLKPNVNITAINAASSITEQGNGIFRDIKSQFLFVNKDERISFNASFNQNDRILEIDRNINFIGKIDERAFRTLSPDTQDWDIGFSASKNIFSEVTATISAVYSKNETTNLLGLRIEEKPVPILQRINSNDLNIGFSLSSPLAPTTWTFNSSFTNISNDSETDAILPEAAVRQTNFEQKVFNAEFTINTLLADLISEPITLSTNIGWYQQLQSLNIFDIIEIPAVQNQRDIFSFRNNIVFPIILPKLLIGEVQLTGNSQIQYFSDFGLFSNIGYGLNWNPIKDFKINFNISHKHGVPSLQNIGAPQIISPNSRIFDFSQNINSFATIIDGGNQQLTPDKRNIYSIGLNWSIASNPRLTINSDYIRSRITSEVRNFALLTEEFETAFPNRVERNNFGQILSFDRRPVQAQNSQRDEIRTVISFSKRLKAKRIRQTEANSKNRRSRRPPALRVSAVHRWMLRDNLTIADNVPSFDFLNGSSNNQIGGTPRHRVDINMNWWKNGLGISSVVSHQTGSIVRQSNDILSFSDLTIANLRIGYELNYTDKLLNLFPFLEETRVSFGIDNIFNDVINVRNEDGQIPINFQPDIIDPKRRIFRFEIRKRF